MKDIAKYCVHLILESVDQEIKESVIWENKSKISIRCLFITKLIPIGQIPFKRLILSPRHPPCQNQLLWLRCRIKHLRKLDPGTGARLTSTPHLSQKKQHSPHFRKPQHFQKPLKAPKQSHYKTRRKKNTSRPFFNRWLLTPGFWKR